MSHIGKEKRRIIEASPIDNVILKDNRELSYAIVTLVEQYLSQHPFKFDEVNGVLERVKDHIQDKYIRPFERQKKFDNGEILKR